MKNTENENNFCGKKQMRKTNNIDKTNNNDKSNTSIIKKVV